MAQFHVRCSHGWKPLDPDPRKDRNAPSQSSSPGSLHKTSPLRPLGFIYRASPYAKKVGNPGATESAPPVLLGEAPSGSGKNENHNSDCGYPDNQLVLVDHRFLFEVDDILDTNPHVIRVEDATCLRPREGLSREDVDDFNRYKTETDFN